MSKTARTSKKKQPRTVSRAPKSPGKSKAAVARKKASPPRNAPAPKKASASRRAPSPRPRNAAGADPGVGKYVYCIIRSREAHEFGRIGMGAAPSEVHTIGYKDLAAVCSDTPMGVHDPTRENVLVHQAVNETVMRQHTVIPMSFGTVFKTHDDILELLRSAYEAFSDVLNKMENKFEFGLKVIWDRDQIVREIESQDEDVRRLKAEISNQKGSTYFARMQYGRLVDATLQTRSEELVSEIFSNLRDVSVASRLNKPIGDKMILNAAFLVFRDRESDFDRRLKEVGGRHGKLTFKYTGPWPPYNFVNIRLKLERAR